MEIMPAYDFGSVDEAGDDTQFNWGYDPVNYNVPEGSYATDARHGEVRIREMKEMVQALHAQGFGVILDVVYNHTYSLDSWFQRTAPWYFTGYLTMAEFPTDLPAEMMWPARGRCVRTISLSQFCTGQRNTILTGSGLI